MVWAWAAAVGVGAGDGAGAGAGAGATMSARNGPMAMAGSAVVGGVLLALIEGVGIVMNKWQAEQMRAPMMEPPQDPSILGPNASSHQ